MFHQIQQAIEPQLFIEHVIDNWHNITHNLSEANRKRRLQLSKRVT
jgi:hypothetical protein